MQDLIEQLKSKAGLSDEQAVKAIETIKEFIQSKLPPMMQGMVDNFIGTQTNDKDDILG
jgi:nucleoid DNA-binding protein